MDILAVNKPRHDYKWFEHSNLYCIFRVLVMLAMFVCCIIGVWSVWVDSEAPNFLIVYPLVLAFLGFYILLLSVDIFLRWNYVVETMSVQDGKLVIECKGSILFRRKEIPLASIRHFGTPAIHMYETPETLCVFYARHRHYSLGIHMQYKEIEALEKRIMQLARGN